MRAEELTRDVSAQVAATVHPAIGLPIGDLDLVDAVDVSRAGVVTARVRSLTQDHGADAAMIEQVRAGVRSIVGVTEVQVRATPLTQGARAELAKKLRERSGRPGGFGDDTRIYAVGSGKGGVGKSTLTANLAVALSQAGLRVGLLDADVWGYSIPQLYGIREAPIALNGIMLPVCAHGVRLMSIGFFVAEEQPVVWRGPMLQKALEQFLSDVYWGDLDVLLVDLPPGTGDVPLTVLELLPSASLLVVTTPQGAAEQVAARVGRMALDSRMPLAGVVENMAGSIFGSGGGERLADTLGTSLIGSIALDPAVCEAGETGTPLLAGNPEHAVSRQVQAMAQALPVVRQSLVNKLLPLFVT